MPIVHEELSPRILLFLTACPEDLRSPRDNHDSRNFLGDHLDNEQLAPRTPRKGGTKRDAHPDIQAIPQKRPACATPVSRGAAIVRSPARSAAKCRVSCAQSSAPEGRLNPDDVKSQWRARI